MLKPANTIPETVEALGLSRATLYELIRTGELRTYTVGRRRYCSEEAIREFIRTREQASHHAA